MTSNISRYDLPDPETYKTFFSVHPLYEFPSLQSTCTFFKVKTSKINGYGVSKTLIHYEAFYSVSKYLFQFF